MSRKFEVDDETYRIDLLNERDKETAVAMTNLSDNILSDEIVSDYIERFIQKSNGGNVISSLVREAILPFVSYLKELSDYHICNFIIDKIDGYSEQEYEELKKQAEGKE